MGYSYSTLPSQLEIGGEGTTYFSITTVAADKTLPDIILPSFTGYTLLHVFVDFYYRYAVDNSNLVNYLINDTNLVVTRGGNSSTALVLSAGSLYCYHTLSNIPQVGARIYGSTDVKSRFALGGTTTCKLSNAASNHDSLSLRDVQVIVRIILKGGIS